VVWDGCPGKGGFRGPGFFARIYAGNIAELFARIFQIFFEMKHKKFRRAGCSTGLRPRGWCGAPLNARPPRISCTQSHPGGTSQVPSIRQNKSHFNPIRLRIPARSSGKSANNQSPSPFPSHSDMSKGPRRQGGKNPPSSGKVCAGLPGKTRRRSAERIPGKTKTRRKHKWQISYRKPM
jgi:hypothetical protein